MKDRKKIEHVPIGATPSTIPYETQDGSANKKAQDDWRSQKQNLGTSECSASEGIHPNSTESRMIPSQDGSDTCNFKGPGAYAITGILGGGSESSAMAHSFSWPATTGYGNDVTTTEKPIHAIALNEDEVELAAAHPVPRVQRCREGLGKHFIRLLCAFVVSAVVFVVVIAAYLLTRPTGVDSPAHNNTNSTPQEQPDFNVTTSPRRIDTIGDILLNYSTAQEFYNESSPQSRALKWLTYSDPSQLPADHVDEIGQRYVMAVLLYSLGVHTFESKDQSECRWDGTEEISIDIDEPPLPLDEGPLDEGPGYQTAAFCAPVRPCFEEPTRPVRHEQCDELLMKVGCDMTSQVRKLDLCLPKEYCSEGAATIPYEVRHLSGLEHLAVAAEPNCGFKPFSVIGHFDHLTSLDLSRTYLGGAPMSSVIDGVAQPSQLEDLELFGCSLQGSIPAEIGSFTSMERLRLGGNYLTGSLPEKILHLPKLTYLDLSYNSIQGRVSSLIGELSMLETLAILDTYLSGELPTRLGELTSLKYLGISYNFLRGTIPTEIGQIGNLTTFLSSDTGLNGQIPKEMWNLSLLEWLDLSKNGLSGPIPSEIGRVHQLTRLDLSNNFLSGTLPTEFGIIKGLKEIQLKGTFLSGKIPTQLGRLKQIEVLRMDGNDINGSIPYELTNAEKLEVLDLGSNSLTGSIVPHFGNMSRLQYIDVSYNHIDGSIPTDLGRANRLVHINLNSNSLGGAIPSHLGRLTSLKSLQMSFNYLSGPIPSELGQLSGLTDLYLTENSLTGTIPEELGNLSSLQYLYLSFNNLEGTIPLSLCRRELDSNGRVVRLHGNNITVSPQVPYPNITGCIPMFSGEGRKCQPDEAEFTLIAYSSFNSFRRASVTVTDSNGRLVKSFLGTFCGNFLNVFFAMCLLKDQCYNLSISLASYTSYNAILDGVEVASGNLPDEIHVGVC